MKRIFSPGSMSRFITRREAGDRRQVGGASPHALGVQPAGASFMAPPAERTLAAAGLGTVEYWTVISEAGTAVTSGSRPGFSFTDSNAHAVEFRFGFNESHEPARRRGQHPRHPRKAGCRRQRPWSAGCYPRWRS